MAVQFGLNSLHYAVATYDEATKKYTYGVPKKIACAVTLSVSAVGDISDFHCDDKVGFTAVSNQGYDGTLTGAMLSDDFRKDVLGEVEDDNKMKVEYSNIQPKQFALLFQVQGDVGETRFVFWNCKATRPSATHNTTTDSISVDTQELNFSAKPREDYATKASADKTATNYPTWFTTVPEPTMVVSSEAS